MVTMRKVDFVFQTKGEIIVLLLFAGVLHAFSQSFYWKDDREQKMLVNKQYYAALTFSHTAGGKRAPIPIYSSIAGPEKKLACYINSQNVYKVQAVPDSRIYYYYKLFNYDGQYLGWINQRFFVLCNAPKAPEIEMVHVQGGTFEMGDNSDVDASPVHLVSLSDYEIGKYEITLEQWQSIMGNYDTNNLRVTQQMVDGRDDLKFISWDDVHNYIKILNKLTGKKYRLPTEAEWEYAARGGNASENYVYSGSNNINEVGFCIENSRIEDTPKRRKQGVMAPNELGLYDMSGNVWEFCEDYYNYYTEEPKANPLCMQSNKLGQRVLRGGSYLDPMEYCKTHKREKVDPQNENNCYGFRLVIGEPDHSLPAPSTTLDEHAQISSSSKGLIIYYKDGKYGLAREEDKKIITQPKYEWIMPTEDGISIIKRDGKFGYMDKDGKTILSCDYDTIMCIQPTVYVIVKDNKKGLIDCSGKIFLPCEYDEIDDYGNLSFQVKKENIVGVVGTRGEWRIPFAFQTISPCDKSGYYWALYNDKIVLRRNYEKENCTPLDADSVFIQYEAKRVKVSNAILAKAPETSKEVYYYWKGGRIGAFSTSGKYNCDFDEIGIINGNEYIWAKNEQGVLLLFMNGKPLNKDVYDNVFTLDTQDHLQPLEVSTSSFKDNKFYYAEKNKTMCVINSAGKKIVPMEYEEIGPFYENFSVVKSEGKYGFVDINGHLVIPCQFVSAKHFSGGMAAVELEGKRGISFVNSDGIVVIKAHDYDEVGYFVNGRCLVRKGNKSYYIDKEGNKIKE